VAVAEDALADAFAAALAHWPVTGLPRVPEAWLLVTARRRMSERPGIGADALSTDLRLRDESDAARMQPAPDAQEIDTTHLQVEDVVERIEALVRARATA